LNLIKRGVDYGWPHVTYGKSYDAPGQPALRADASVGSHDGYERPRYAFIPSIGVSNLIEASTLEFPHWDRRLVVSSLKGNTLHVLRVEDDVVISDEPITITNQRIRDLISLSDGRMAFATDEGDIFLISNAEKVADRPREALLTGIKDLGPGPDAGWTPADLGQIYFTRACSQCHSLLGDIRGGPPLNALMGRRVGENAHFDYSDAMSGRSEVWTPERLTTFLKDVNGAYPGAYMPQPAATDWIPFIVDYLATRDDAGAKLASVGERG
jgi:cytochrome c2